MSLVDKLKKFAQPYADDEYDDYDEDEEFLDDYDEAEEAPRRAPVRRNRPAPAPVADEEDDADDFGFSMSTPSSTPAASTGSFSGQVLKMQSGPKQEVVLFRPSSFGDTSQAVDHLKHNKAVVLNLEDVDKAMSRRVVDILSGAVYALEGEVTKIAKAAYLFYPKNMDVTGTLESLREDIDSYT